MALSLVACSNGGKLPSVEKRIEAIENGELTWEDAEKKGWLDDAFKAYIDKISDPAVGTVDAGGQGGNMSTNKMIPSPLEANEKYNYEYLGLSYTLPGKVNQLIRDGRIFMHVENKPSDDNEIEYAYLYFNLVPEKIKDQGYATYENFAKWVEQTKRVGTIGVYSADYLKSNFIEGITKCDNNTELGKTKDGAFVYYLSTNEMNEENASNLLKQAKIQTGSALPKIPEGDPYFNILGEARVEVGDLGDFKAENLDGESFGNEIFVNYDLTLVNLWTTTCTYCIQEMPDLESIRTELQDKGIRFNIVGMCLDINPSGTINEKKLSTAKDIVGETKIGYETLIPDDILWQGRLKGINAFPESFFVDKNGKIVGETYIGSNDKAGWVKIIQTELDNLSK